MIELGYFCGRAVYDDPLCPPGLLLIEYNDGLYLFSPTLALETVPETKERQ